MAEDKTPQEEIEIFLARLEEEEQAPPYIEDFKIWLGQQIGVATPAQEEALWEAKKSQISEEEHGIRPVIVTYISRGTRELRYAVQGLAGLWGFESIQEIREAEGW